ncbi:MBG domain-containing protein [Flavobacterium sp. B11]|uniref:MBG domain-containing protein n=1 Tax=Flavobacterium movens TaxID=214860 RepID=UPI0031D3CDC7
MRKIYSIILVIFVFSSSIFAQSTETFETESTGSLSFTDNNVIFNITSQKGGTFAISAYGGTGWSGTAPDNKYIDNSNTADIGIPVQFTIKSTSSPFKLKSIYLLLRQSDLDTGAGTCTITGKLNGSTVFTTTGNSGFNIDNSISNGYTNIDLSTYGGFDYSNAIIDEYVISTTGTFEYVALDAMKWEKILSTITAPANLPTFAACSGTPSAQQSFTVSGTNLNSNVTITPPTGYEISLSSGSNFTSSITLASGGSTLSPTQIYVRTNSSANNNPSGNIVIASLGAPSVTVAVSSTITPSPIVSQSPVSKVVCFGSNTTFSITDLGATSYQWYQDAAGIITPVSNGGTSPSFSNATTKTLSISNVNSSINGYKYYCIASNGSCSITTSSAVLTVSPEIISNVSANTPSAYGANNGTATVTVSGGSSNYSYSWAPSGGTRATASGLAPMTYTVTITDNFACTSTQTVVIAESPGASTNVTSLSGFTSCPNLPSSPQSFRVKAGQLSSNLDLSAPAGFEIATTAGGSYTPNLSITPSGGIVTDRNIFIRIAATATGTPSGNLTVSSTGIPTKNVALSGTITPVPAITSQPSSNTICTGGSTTFNINTTNATSYKWQVDEGSGFGDILNGGPYSGVTSTTLTITGATAAMRGNVYRALATNSCNTTAYSNNATLIVNSAPSITTQPSSTSVCIGDNAAFSVTASNATGYQWYVDKGTGFNAISNNAQFSGVTTSTLTINGATAELGGYAYRVVVTGGCNPSATSVNVNLTINSAPSITGQPSASSVCQGANTTFTAIASNATIYQWQVDKGEGDGFANISDGGPYSGVNNATLTVTGATVAMNGYSYRAIAAGICTPPATSNSAKLTVNAAPAITSNPSSIAICSGGTTTFSVTASNATAYKWQVDNGQGGGFVDVQNNAPYSGITTSTLTITGAPAAFNGYKYRAVVGGTCPPSATSSNATLTVNYITILTPKVDIACFGDATGQATATATGGTGSYTYSWSNGGDTATITGLIAGTYSVTVTDENSCSNTASVTIGQPASALTLAKGTVNNTSCYRGANGTAQVIASGGTRNYTYSWNTNPIQTTATATGLSAGTYTVTVKDANQCVKTLDFPISEPPAFTITSSQTNISCNGGSNGTATVNVTGGTGAYTYSWAPSGGSAATASGLQAGTYTVTINDANNCQTSQRFTFIDPPVLNATQSQTDVLCNGGATGTATVSASGGSGNLTYLWTPSRQTGATATGLSAGTYTCKITDANSCFITKTFIIGEPSALNASTTQIDATCSTGGEATVIPSGGVGGYSYSWAPSGGIAATARGLSAGTYHCTITDGNGCSIIRNVTINTTNTVVATADKTDVLCNGASTGSAWVVPSGAPGPFTYEWTPNVGNTSRVYDLAAGNYSVKITANNGCSIVKNFTINEPSAIVITPGAKTNVSCNGGNNGSASVSATGGTGTYTYSWNTTPVQSTATATGLKAGTYTVTVKDANSCTKTQSVIITEPDALIATTSQTDVSCNGGSNGSATVNVTGGTGLYTYSWAPSGGTNATASGLAAGTYTVTVKDANLCQTTATVTIAEPPVLKATIAKTDVLCNQANNGTATVTPSGGTFPYTYSWSPSGGSDATATGLSPNTYFVTVTDANGCFVTESVQITEPSALSASDTHTNVSCNGGNNGTASVVATGGTGTYTYSWSPSGGNTATATGLTAGIYTVTVTDENLCFVTNTITITEPDALNLTTTPVDVSCHNGNNGSATVSVTGGTGAYSYSWLPFGGNAATATNLTAGTYTVTVTDANSCSASATVKIMQPANPVVLNTNAISEITVTGASLSGTASSDGINTDNGSCLTEVGFVYAQHANPTIDDTRINATATLGIFTNSLSGLRGNRTYYVRTYAVNSNGFVNYGNEVNFTTQKYTLTITATTGHTKVYGTADPVFNYTASGFANGDTNAILSGLLTRDAGENVGKYNIKLGTINAGADYVIAFTGAEFEITKANQTITWNQTLEFGCADSNSVALTATTDSGLPVSYAIANAALGTISGSTLNIIESGNSTITATQNGDENHNAATAIVKPLEISQSGLVIQQWANVLLFDNKSNNFVAWQWYKNGTAISGATRQYYSEIQPLNGTYHVIAKDKNGNSIKSCPTETTGTAFSKKIKIYPNPVRPRAEFTLECDFSESQLNGSEIVIYDITGKLLQTISNAKAKNQIIAPSQAALYIVVLKLADGQLKTINLLVK